MSHFEETKSPLMVIKPSHINSITALPSRHTHSNRNWDISIYYEDGIRACAFSVHNVDCSADAIFAGLRRLTAVPATEYKMSKVCNKNRVAEITVGGITYSGEPSPTPEQAILSAFQMYEAMHPELFVEK